MESRHVLGIKPNIRTVSSAGVIRFCKKTGHFLAIRRKHTTAFFHLMYGIYVRADIPFLAKDLAVKELEPLLTGDAKIFTAVFTKTYGAREEDAFFGIHQFIGFIDDWKKNFCLCLPTVPWTIPKGKSDGIEALVDTAKREFHEETGLDFEPRDLEPIIHRKFWRDTTYLTLYFTEYVEEEISKEPIDKIEIEEISWRSKDDIDPSEIFRSFG